MSNLRDMIVAIDFDGIDIGRLNSMDSIINTLENNIMNMGGAINNLESAANQLGNHGSNAMDQIVSGANDAENAIDQLGDAANNAGDDAAGGMNDAEDAIDELGDAAGDAGDQIDDGLGGAEDAAGDVETAADNAGGGFRRFGAIAVGAIAAVATAAIGLGTIMGGMAQENEKAMDRLAAKTGATGQELAGLEGVVKDVFNNGFGESIGQVSDDVVKLESMFGHLNDESLRKLAEGAYFLSDAWGPEVGEITRTVATLTKTFDGLSETQALDLINTGFQRTGDYSDDLLDTFNEYSTQFKALGYGAEGFTATLIAGAEAGAYNMDKLADATKESFLKLGEGSKETNGALKLMGLDANQVMKDINSGGDGAQKAFMAVSTAIATIEEPAKRNQAAIAAFGTPLEDLGPQFQSFFGTVNQDLGNFEGSTKKASDVMYDNFGDRMTSIWRNLKSSISETFANNGGTALLDGIATKAEELIPKVEDLIGKGLEFANTIQENWPQIKETLIGLGTAVLSFTLIMGGMSIIKTITAATALWSAGNKIAALSMLGLNGAMLANPITWVVIGIASLIAIGVLLYRNWDTVKERALALWDSIGGLQGAIALILGPIGFLINAGIDLAKNWDSTKSVWENVWGSIQRSAATSVNAVIGLINDMIETINKIPGVNIPIVAKVDWGEAKGPTSSGGAANKISGAQSHATGLESVPWDNYAANLHKDEAVLTAQQSNALRNAGILGNNGSKPTLDLGANKIEPRGSGGGTGTFAPVVQVTVQGGGDDQALGDRIAAAATKAIDKFWRQMALQ